MRARITLRGVTWSEYVARISGDDQGRDFEDKTGLDGSTLSRWKKGDAGGLRADKVTAFARGYHVPVLEAFIAAGFLTPEEAEERPTAAPAINSLSDDQLVDEIRRRLRERGGHGGDTATKTVTALSERRPRVPEKRVARRPDKS